MLPENALPFALIVVAVAVGVPLLVYGWASLMVKQAEWQGRSRRNRRIAAVITAAVFFGMAVMYWVDDGFALRTVITAALAAGCIVLELVLPA
jgi:hypothetical protein